MTCPKCQGKMEAVEFQGVQIDRCSSCGGLWFDLLEHEDLKQLQGSEEIDVGGELKLPSHDPERHVLCPREGARMVPMVDISQPHIWFESCPVCHGAYFDAGEFKDLKNVTFIERMRRRGRARPA